MNIFELVPLVLFFIAHSKYGMVWATGVLMVSSTVIYLVQLLLKKRVEKSQTISLGLIIFFGAITLITDNPVFIQIKATLCYLLFASILFGAMLRGKLIIRDLLYKALPINDDILWRNMTICWILFFITSAGLNEFIRTNFTESQWIIFKTTLMPILTLAFTIAQSVFFVRKFQNK